LATPMWTTPARPASTTAAAGPTSRCRWSTTQTAAFAGLVAELFQDPNKQVQRAVEGFSHGGGTRRPRRGLTGVSTRRPAPYGNFAWPIQSVARILPATPR
jgi:hypothetical protein